MHGGGQLRKGETRRGRARPGGGTGAGPGLRREGGGHAGGRHRAVRPRARLLREPRPRRNLCRARERPLRGGWARRHAARPLGPGGADQARRCRRGGPRDLVRARGDDRARPGQPVIAVAALVQLLTSLISCRRPGSLVHRPARQDHRSRRHPLPAGVPGRDPARGGDRAERGPDPERGPRPASRGGLRAGRRMLGGFRNVEGVDLAERGLKPRVVRWTSWGSRPTASWSWSPTPTVEGTRRRSACSSRPRAGLDAIRDPEAATDAVLAAGDSLDPELTAAEIEAPRCRCSARVEPPTAT